MQHGDGRTADRSSSTLGETYQTSFFGSVYMMGRQRANFFRTAPPVFEINYLEIERGHFCSGQRNPTAKL